MPIAYPGNQATKTARSKVGGGFESAIESAAFSPFRVIDFDGLSNGQSVVGTGSVEGSRFDSVLGNIGFADGFGVQATTSIARPGKTSSCAMSISAGSDGDPAGGATGAGQGAFGGKFSFPPADQIGEGGELWFGAWLYFPSGWSWDSSGATPNFIKFFRLENDDGASGRLDMHALTGGYDGSVPASDQIGWTLGVSEFDPANQAETHRKTQEIATLGAWRWVEVYHKFSSDRSLSEQVIWLDEAFVYSRKGPNVQWVDPSGTLQTETLPDGIRNLPTSTSKTDALMVFTYWNGGAPQDQTCYLQTVVIHPSTAGNLPTKTDQFGNVMMGML